MVRCAPTPIVKAWVDNMPIKVSAAKRVHLTALSAFLRKMKLQKPVNPIHEIVIGRGNPGTKLIYGKNMNMPPIDGSANNAMAS